MMQGHPQRFAIYLSQQAVILCTEDTAVPADWQHTRSGWDYSLTWLFARRVAAEKALPLINSIAGRELPTP